jgi:UDP:flavonoid glycosyltransferase YjiC (YdhE family)
LLPAAEALRAAGHDVLIASDPRIERERAVADLPVTILAHSWDAFFAEQAAFAAELTERPPEQRMAAAAERFVSRAEAVTPSVVDVIEAYRPDVIYRDQGFQAAWFAGLIVGVPVASFAFFPLPSVAEDPARADRYRAALRAVGAPDDLDSMDQWLTILAMPHSWIGDVPLHPTAHLVQPADPTDAHDDGTAAALLAGLPDRATVYVTLGTAFAGASGLFQTVLDGVGSVDVNVIATTGTTIDADTLRVPSNTRVASFVPQSLLLPHCDAMVAHGGYGSLMGALRAGLPVVSVPLAAADNEPNAMRVERLGAGKALIEPRRSAEDVAAALTEVLQQPSYRAHAQGIADEIAALPPPAHAATLLEQLATTRAPVVA